MYDFEEAMQSTILGSLIEKATSSYNNYTAINSFFEMVTDQPDSASLAIQLITCKMQSTKEGVVLQTLHMLETCLERDCSPLLIEVGKFRFLNELIKLVSPKYHGNSTPPAVRNKIVELLKTWSVKYPKETKIADAYEMLVRQGVVKYDMVNTAAYSNPEPTNCSRPALHEDDIEKSKMLQKLLRSNKPDDLKAANLLIKTMVKEKEEREELKLIENNTKLLSEMLSNLNAGSSREDIQLIRELKETCVNMKPTLTYMISSSNKSSKESTELFEVNDLLNETLVYYHQVMVEKRMPTKPEAIRVAADALKMTTQSSPPTLLDFGNSIDDDSPILPTHPMETNGRANSLKCQPTGTVKSESNVDALKDIFDSTFGILEDEKKHLVASEHTPINSTKLFQDLNTLGKSLLETRKSDANPEEVRKVTLNNLAARTPESISSDDQLIGEEEELVNGHEARPSKPDESNDFIEPLSDVFVHLMDIKTEDNKKLTAFEDPTGITVCIQLAKNKPREDISVFLVLANSRKSEVITHFLFQPVVSKDCRLKLQPSSKTELPPYNPYIPMDTIVQIMLIASLKREHIPLKFVISYNLKDEMITEMGELSELPLK